MAGKQMTLHVTRFFGNFSGDAASNFVEEVTKMLSQDWEVIYSSATDEPDILVKIKRCVDLSKEINVLEVICGTYLNVRIFYHKSWAMASIIDGMAKDNCYNHLMRRGLMYLNTDNWIAAIVEANICGVESVVHTIPMNISSTE